MRLTALGIIIVVHPSLGGTGKWCLIQADKNGNATAGSLHDSQAEAKEERSKLFTLHRKLAKQKKAKS